MITNKIHISKSFGNRLDVSFYKERFDFFSKSYPLYELNQLLYVNPQVSFKGLSNDDEISFIPMEVIDEKNGVVSEYRTTTVANNVGFTKFEDNDLLWAKITPCMQNGKSAIARNLKNGVGCGSTEFYVLRPKLANVLIEYIHYILRDKRVLESAKNSFGGSAGQQRVSSSYLRSIKIPLPPIEVQQKIVDIYTIAQNEKQIKEQEAKALLDHIDVYLLERLNLSLPETHKRELSFNVNFSDIIGERLNPFSYNIKTLTLKKMIESSALDKKRLSEMILSSISGDWGIDENIETANDYTKCLVIRATEFDNKYNLNLDNSRVKYRKMKSEKLHKMYIQEGDILVEKSGGSPDQPVGRVALITKDIIDNNTIGYSNFIHKIRLDNKQINPTYAYYYLSTMYRIGMTESMQSQTNGIRNLIMSIFLKQLVLLPRNQSEIVKHINDIYIKAASIEKQADSLLKEAIEKVEKIILE